jgi:hypothetical protein
MMRAEVVAIFFGENREVFADLFFTRSGLVSTWAGAIVSERGRKGLYRPIVFRR